MSCKYKYNNEWYSEEQILNILQNNKELSQLYQNLLKELEYGKGKEVLDRVKKDYGYKGEVKIKYNQDLKKWTLTTISDRGLVTNVGRYDSEQDAISNIPTSFKYTLEEQQEEAIVELLGLYTAGRLNKVKDGKLITILKRLLKEMKDFMKSLFNQKEVNIDSLPDNMTLGDIADLLAYSNSKLILPGNEVVYTTPDNQQFKTYIEASKYLSELGKLGEVNLSGINTKIKSEVSTVYDIPELEFNYDGVTYTKGKLSGWWDIRSGKTVRGVFENRAVVAAYNNTLSNFSLIGFIEKNKKYEQSKEIIEEWKKVNNIKYDPEEVYSRGQGFYSVVGAYSKFDVNLLFQNLLQHLEDNKKAGGEFTISAFTRPIDRKLGHLEGDGGKIRFKIFPKSEDIKWAANTDVYSGSVWDASKKINKDKKSEIIGVSYTKSPDLYNINTVQPNLASIINDIAHAHNELGVTLTKDNFRLEYDDNVPYQTKKLINNINKILDERYGELLEPKIFKEYHFIGVKATYKGDTTFKITNSYEEGSFRLYDISNGIDNIIGLKAHEFEYERPKVGKQPTQINETLKKSIENVKNEVIDRKYFAREKKKDNTYEYYDENWENQGENMGIEPLPTNEEKERRKKSSVLGSLGNYTSQAEINLKIAALKEGVRKYPRILIRSEIKSIQTNLTTKKEDFFFQKIPSLSKENIQNMNETEVLNSIETNFRDENLAGNTINPNLEQRFNDLLDKGIINQACII